MNNYFTTLKDFTTSVKRSLGATSTEVNCIAEITDNANKVTESYEVTFERNPISGMVRSVIVEPREDTTEFTLTSEKVEELVEEELDRL